MQRVFREHEGTVNVPPCGFGNRHLRPDGSKTVALALKYKSLALSGQVDPFGYRGVQL